MRVKSTNKICHFYTTVPSVANLANSTSESGVWRRSTFLGWGKIRNLSTVSHSVHPTSPPFDSHSFSVRMPPALSPESRVRRRVVACARCRTRKIMVTSRLPIPVLVDTLDSNYSVRRTLSQLFEMSRSRGGLCGIGCFETANRAPVDRPIPRDRGRQGGEASIHRNSRPWASSLCQSSGRSSDQGFYASIFGSYSSSAFAPVRCGWHEAAINDPVRDNRH
jgi:hypothetical protein